MAFSQDKSTFQFSECLNFDSQIRLHISKRNDDSPVLCFSRLGLKFRIEEAKKAGHLVVFAWRSWVGLFFFFTQSRADAPPSAASHDLACWSKIKRKENQNKHVPRHHHTIEQHGNCGPSQQPAGGTHTQHWRQ
jgi:hypothetical protein